MFMLNYATYRYTKPIAPMNMGMVVARATDMLFSCRFVLVAAVVTNVAAKIVKAIAAVVVVIFDVVVAHTCWMTAAALMMLMKMILVAACVERRGDGIVRCVTDCVVVNVAAPAVKSLIITVGRQQIVHIKVVDTVLQGMMMAT